MKNEDTMLGTNKKFQDNLVVKYFAASHNIRGWN